MQVTPASRMDLTTSLISKFPGVPAATINHIVRLGMETLADKDPEARVVIAFPRILDGKECHDLCQIVRSMELVAGIGMDTKNNANNLIMYKKPAPKT